MSRFASIWAMKDGSHVINFAMRMPEKNSFVAFTRASVTFASCRRTNIIRRMTYALSGSVALMAATAINAHQPTSWYSSTMETTKTVGELQRYIQYCKKSLAFSTSVLSMLMIRPVLISGRASDLAEMVKHFSNIAAERALRQHIPPLMLT
ncbi:hypothetical protein DQ04_14381010 [Trypanosoma grayi]|uniref:hypothetical protein n=1 Tax=Trypanosoma grayi TaxID=71804 RepID=UPI0004F3F61A|nr:hypothetical protein DQ04_14381010 [Trypanosoma grayi]KEG06366.1 hypothetical protein DQ04_14381010 [Trypanosoma grayi]